MFTDLVVNLGWDPAADTVTNADWIRVPIQKSILLQIRLPRQEPFQLQKLILLSIEQDIDPDAYPVTDPASDWTTDLIVDPVPDTATDPAFNL